LVGTQHGCGIVAQGSERDSPHRHVDPADAVAEVVRLASETREATHA